MATRKKHKITPADLMGYMPPSPEEQASKEYWAMMNALATWIDKNYGPRCQESSGGCGCCQAWAVYDLARAIFMEPDHNFTR